LRRNPQARRALNSAKFVAWRWRSASELPLPRSSAIADDMEKDRDRSSSSCYLTVDGSGQIDA
jgi:hypothetical protein